MMNTLFWHCSEASELVTPRGIEGDKYFRLPSVEQIAGEGNCRGCF